MELVDFSLIFHGTGGLFVDFSWNWWTFRGFFVELVDFSWIFHGIGGLFVDFSWNWWIFRGINGFFVDPRRPAEKCALNGPRRLGAKKLARRPAKSALPSPSTGGRAGGRAPFRSKTGFAGNKYNEIATSDKKLSFVFFLS